MTEIAKCVCVAEAIVTTGLRGTFVMCHSCGWSSPVCGTAVEAIAAWNAAMSREPERPRPVVRFSLAEVVSYVAMSFALGLGLGSAL